MASIKLSEPRNGDGVAGESGEVRCTGDAEVMAVKYGRDGRCGRTTKVTGPG